VLKEMIYAGYRADLEISNSFLSGMCSMGIGWIRLIRCWALRTYKIILDTILTSQMKKYELL
jgi:hypothetical protein